MDIISSQNQKFKEWKSLLTRQGLKKSESFLVFGQKVVDELIASRPDDILTLLKNEKSPLDLKGKTMTLSSELFKELDIFGTHSPIAVVKKPRLNNWNSEAPINGLEVLCALSDPNNLGALIRTCSAFSVSKLILLKESASPFNPKASRAASGTLWQIPFELGPSIQEIHVKCVSLDLEGEDINAYSWPKNTRLLIGEEGQGLPKHIQGDKLHIPMNSQVESLNATVASAIAINQYYQMNK